MSAVLSILLCGGMLFPAPADSIVGSYKLATVAEHPVPYTMMPEDAPAPIEIVASTLVVKEDGTFVVNMTYGIMQGSTRQTVSREMTGTWARDGAGYALQWSGAGSTPGKLDGDRFSFVNEGITFAYKRVKPEA